LPDGLTDIIYWVLNPGSYSIVFNGTNLSNSVYFFKLEAGNFTEAKKMVLIK
jgi:hypothetical protein